MTHKYWHNGQDETEQGLHTQQSGKQAGRSVPESSSDPLPFYVAVVASSTAVVSLANLATFPLPCLVRCAIFVFE